MCCPLTPSPPCEVCFRGLSVGPRPFGAHTGRWLYRRSSSLQEHQPPRGVAHSNSVGAKLAVAAAKPDMPRRQQPPCASAFVTPPAVRIPPLVFLAKRQAGPSVGGAEREGRMFHDLARRLYFETMEDHPLRSPGRTFFNLTPAPPSRISPTSRNMTPALSKAC